MKELSIFKTGTTEVRNKIDQGEFAVGFYFHQILQKLKH
jgi:hypothetical protein